MTILRRVPRQAVIAFYEDYAKGNLQHQRLGQAFLNRFYPAVSDSELFYEENDATAAAHIEEHYVVLEIAA